MNKLGATYRAVKGWFWPEQQMRSRLVCLDFLRGVAILLVMGAHMPGEGLSEGVPAGGVLRGWHFIGWIGVDLFFVLSGFLVGGLLLAEIRRSGNAEAKRFLIRRGFKIWPAYYVYLLCVPFMQLLDGETHYLRAAIWSLRANWFHLQNYWLLGPAFAQAPNYLTPRPHTWSLAVEEHFYLGLALVLGLVAAQKGGAERLRRLVPAVLGLCLLCTGMRYGLGRAHPQADIFYFQFPTHLRVDGLALGVGLAYLYHFHSERLWALWRWWPALVGGGLAIASPLAFVPRGAQMAWWGYTCLYVGFGMVLLGLLYGHEQSRLVKRLLSIRPARVVALIGFYSYSIYLWHTDLPHLLLRPVIGNGWSGANALVRGWGPVALYVVLAAATGIVLGRAVEIPALVVRDRLFPRKAAPVDK